MKPPNLKTWSLRQETLSLFYLKVTVLLLGQERGRPLSSGEREGGVAAAESLQLCLGIPIHTSLTHSSSNMFSSLPFPPRPSQTSMTGVKRGLCLNLLITVHSFKVKDGLILAAIPTMGAGSHSHSFHLECFFICFSCSRYNLPLVGQY